MHRRCARRGVGVTFWQLVDIVAVGWQPVSIDGLYSFAETQQRVKTLTQPPTADPEFPVLMAAAKEDRIEVSFQIPFTTRRTSALLIYRLAVGVALAGVLSPTHAIPLLFFVMVGSVVLGLAGRCYGAAFVEVLACHAGNFGRGGQIHQCFRALFRGQCEAPGYADAERDRSS